MELEPETIDVSSSGGSEAQNYQVFMVFTSQSFGRKYANKWVDIRANDRADVAYLLRERFTKHHEGGTAYLLVNFVVNDA